MPISPELLEILACPDCKSPIVLEESKWIVCTNKECRRRYPIRDDIPVMLIDESEVMDPAAWQEVMKRHGKS